MSDFLCLSREIWKGPEGIALKEGPASIRGALISLALHGRVIRATVQDLAEDWGVHERRAAIIVKRLEAFGMISTASEGRCRLICIETPLIKTCGFHVMPHARRAIGKGGAKWRGVSLSAKLKREVLERDSHTCRYCGASGVPMHVDHVRPVLKGGKDTKANLVAACAPCNLSKGSKTLREWKGATS